MPKSYEEKRVKFLNRAEQKEFIKLVEKRIGANTKKLALISKVSTRQITDWKNAKSTLSLYAFKKFLLLSKIPSPKGIEIIERYAHIKSAGKKGFLAVFKKYGKFPKNEKRRKENWEKWWKTLGKYQKREIFKRKSIKIPKKSIELAELCGILIGDGGITKRQVKITLNCETDKIYSEFVIKLLRKLFNIKPKVYKIKNTKALNISISRSDLVDFLFRHDLKVGNKLKQNLSIPEWILKSKTYIAPCLRGMVDTDGCVVVETHLIKNKKYSYPRLNFTSASPLLVGQTVYVLEKLGFHPKIRRSGRSVQLENILEIWEYFKRIGTSNTKHLKRLGSVAREVEGTALEKRNPRKWVVSSNLTASAN